MGSGRVDAIQHSHLQGFGVILAILHVAPEAIMIGVRSLRCLVDGEPKPAPSRCYTNRALLCFLSIMINRAANKHVLNKVISGNVKL